MLRTSSQAFIVELYEALMQGYGPQGWWPLLVADESEPTGFHCRYHVGDYAHPQTDDARFEICVGAILTQNTAWLQARTALANLRRGCMLSPHALLATSPELIGSNIRPSGYFNAKTKKLKAFAKFYLHLNGTTPSRNELLAVWGIGPETADSMLLYGWSVPTFVIDAYTRRLLAHCGILELKEGYDVAQRMFSEAIPPDVQVYQEYHALLVEHGKRFFSRRPYGVNDQLVGTILDATKIRNAAAPTPLQTSSESVSHQRRNSRARSPRRPSPKPRRSEG